MSNMSRIAGAPVRRDVQFLQQAVNSVLRMVDTNIPPSEREIAEWQAVKVKLIAAYPRLRSSDQYAKAGLSGVYAIRFTTRIRPSQIVAVLAQKNGQWAAIHGTYPVSQIA